MHMENGDGACAFCAFMARQHFAPSLTNEYAQVCVDAPRTDAELTAMIAAEDDPETGVFADYWHGEAA